MTWRSPGRGRGPHLGMKGLFQPGRTQDNLPHNLSWQLSHHLGTKNTHVPEITPQNQTWMKREGTHVPFRPKVSPMSQ